MWIVAPDAAPGPILAFNKSVSMKLTDPTSSDCPAESVAEIVVSSEKSDPWILRINTPDGFVFTDTEVICGPVSVPAVTAFDTADGGFVFLTEMTRGPAVFLTPGFSSSCTVKDDEAGW